MCMHMHMCMCMCMCMYVGCRLDTKGWSVRCRAGCSGAVQTFVRRGDGAQDSAGVIIRLVHLNPPALRHRLLLEQHEQAGLAQDIPECWQGPYPRDGARPAGVAAASRFVGEGLHEPGNVDLHAPFALSRDPSDT